jgi:hypothetical protein
MSLNKLAGYREYINPTAYREALVDLLGVSKADAFGVAVDRLKVKKRAWVKSLLTFCRSKKTE